MPGPMNRGPRGMKPQVKNPGKLLARLMNYVFRDYKIHCIFVFIFIFLGVIANVQGTMFTKNLIDDYITPFLLTDSPDFSPLAHAIGRVAVFYGVGIVSTYAYNRIMVTVTQGTLRDMRNELFAHMQKLPVKYFDIGYLVFSARAVYVVGFVSIIVLPVGCLIVGLVIWLRRRRL